MPLSAGSRLGPYEIQSAIGAGGMGEVYRATDLNLGREVAIKVLPDAFAKDPERMARFEREAKTLASLNHPNVAVIHGLEKSQGTYALVMELVEGEDLSQRITRGRIPLDEALPIAHQIAEALEAAHEQGIIHRDLKPANIKVRPDGAVKVLDFGLAKLGESFGSSTSNASLSQTITSPAMMTGGGVLLGTAAYMAPEQAKGRPADKRSDIWAFGCVLYEMLTGQRAFTGEDVTDTLANVLKSEPDWASVPDVVPPAIRALVRSCLRKDRHHRLGDIAAVRFALDELPVDAPGTSAVGRTPAWRRAMPVAGLGILISVIAALVVWQVKTPTPSPVIRLTLPTGEGETLVGAGRLLAISPDGSRVAYVSNSGLYVRSLSASQPKKLVANESEGIRIPNIAFSPDGQFIAFYSASDQTLKRISVSGGAPVTLCATAAPNGIDWSPEGIVFAVVRKGVMRVNPDGGTPKTLVDVPAGQFVVSPQLLPGGRSVLFTVAEASAALDFDRAQITVQSLDSGKRHVLVEGAGARYVPTGHLLYALGGVLWAVPFDIQRQQLTGAPVAVVEGVARGTGVVGTATAQFSVADAGTLVYVPGPPALSSSRRQLVSIDADGNSRPLNVTPGAYASPRIAPGGSSLAVVIDNGKNVDIWIADLTGASSLRRLTFEGRNRFPVWSPDGRRVMFQSDRQGDRAIWWQPADGSGVAERLTRADGGVAHIPEAWIGHTDNVLFSVFSSPEKASLWTLSVVTKQTKPFDAVTSANPLDSAV